MAIAAAVGAGMHHAGRVRHDVLPHLDVAETVDAGAQPARRGVVRIGVEGDDAGHVGVAGPVDHHLADGGAHVHEAERGRNPRHDAGEEEMRFGLHRPAAHERRVHACRGPMEEVFSVAQREDVLQRHPATREPESPQPDAELRGREPHDAGVGASDQQPEHAASGRWERASG